MQTLYLFILVLFFGYLGTGLVLRRISNKNYFPTGTEYIITGIILSPALFSLINKFLPEYFQSQTGSGLIPALSPFMSAATGFIGFWFGMHFNIVELLKTNRESVRIALYDSLFSPLLTGAATFAILAYFFTDKLDSAQILAASAAIAIMISLPTSFFIDKMKNEHSISGKLTESLQIATRFSKFFSILLFGTIFPLYHSSQNTAPGMTSTEFLVISLGIAVAGGILFFVFLGRESNQQKIVTGTLGITLLGSGIAYYLGISPLALCFIIGVLAGNFSKIKKEILSSIEDLVYPVSLVTVIFAGIMWTLPESEISWAIILILPIVKVFSKILSHKTAISAAFDKKSVNNRQHEIFLPNDIVIFSLLINYATVINNSLTSIVINTAIISAVIFNFSGSHTAKRFLVESDEIRGEVK